MNPPEVPTKPSRSKWKAVLLLIFVFIFGGACGLGGGMLLLRSWIRMAITAPVSQHAPVDKLAARIESNIGRSFKLSADEIRAVHDELAVSTRKAKELRVRVGDEARAIAEDTIARISSHLPADKQTSWRQQATARLEPWGLLPAAKTDDKLKAN